LAGTLDRAHFKDYIKPHIKIMKGAVEATSDWILEDSVLYVLLGRDDNIEKSQVHDEN
jgi:hypothetical protein